MKNKRFFLKKIISLYEVNSKKYKKPNYIYFNLKKIIAGDFERYKIFQYPVIVPLNNGYTGERGKAKNPDKSIRHSMARARQKIFDYIMSNDFEYWATQTFNSQVIDRFNLDEIVRRYNQKLWNLKRRKYFNLKWLIVPEMHQNSAWHLHMLISGIPKSKIVYSGYDYYNKNKNFSRKVYNWVDMINFGFNDYVYIADIEPLEKFRIALYIIKYITKDLIKNRFNKKIYWVSKDLKEPLIVNYLVKDLEKFNIKSNQLILNENTYYIKDEKTGQVINKVDDIMIYKPLPF